jgi:hypothetical protein
LPKETEPKAKARAPTNVSQSVLDPVGTNHERTPLL